MFSITEQLSAATKSQLESQLQFLNHYAATAFEGAQKVIALNLSTTKASVEKSSAAAKQLLEAKDPQEFFNAAKAPTFDNVLAYGRELFSIASKTQADLFQVTKAQFKEAGETVKPLVLEAPLAVVAPPAKAVEAVVAAGEEVAEATVAAPKAAAKKAAKAVAEALDEEAPVPAAKPAAATFPDPKTSVPVKTAEVVHAASAKPKKQ
ncbi:MAG TPA: phasin family protein [Pseudoduganella sp.]